MNIYHLPGDPIPAPTGNRAVALGIFDGLHSGHRAVIAAALAAGDGYCAVYTFTAATLPTKAENGRLCTDAQRNTLLEQMGVTELFETDFDAVRSLTPEQFVEQVLVNQLHAGAVSCGYNYRFGRGRSGDAATLRALCAARGIAVTVLPPVQADDLPINSTAIRRAVAAGDMRLARRLLSRGFCLRLPVTSGQQLGRRLNMPTINQQLPADLMRPRYGVYASAVEIGDTVYTGVTNIGVRPTVGSDAPLAETWIEGFDGDLYGETVAVYPVAFLRPEQKFLSLEALHRQVRADAAAAHRLFCPTGKIRAVLFDFDDTLHPRDDAFHRTVDAFFRRWHSSQPLEKRRVWAEEMFTTNAYGYGLRMPFDQFIEQYLTVRTPDVPVTTEQAVHRFFLDYAASCILSEDALPTLRWLRRQGLLLGVITNGPSFVQNAKIDFTALRPYLDIVAVGGDEGVQKPQPVLFRRVAARLGVAPADCLFVGDHPKNDVLGAREAGMQSVWIDSGHPPDHPCYQTPVPADVPVIHQLRDLQQLSALQG